MSAGTPNLLNNSSRQLLVGVQTSVKDNGLVGSGGGGGYEFSDSLPITSAGSQMPSLEIQIIMCLFYGTLAFTAVTSNLIVCYIVLSNRGMRTALNYFIVNLAVGDILMALLCIPFTFTSNLLLTYWSFGEPLCVLVTYSQTISVFVSAYTMVAISIDKYMAIMYPMRLKMPKQQAKIIILVIWSAALLTSLPTALLSQLHTASSLDLVISGEDSSSLMEQEQNNSTGATLPSQNEGSSTLISRLLEPGGTVASSASQQHTNSSSASYSYSTNHSPPPSQAFSSIAHHQESNLSSTPETSKPSSSSSLFLGAKNEINDARGGATATTTASNSSNGAAARYEQRTYCQENWTFWPAGKSYYSMALMILQFVLPLFVLVITYSRIFIIVWGKRMPGEEDNARDARMARSKRKMIKMVILCVIAFALTWLPFNVLILIGDYNPSVWDNQNMWLIWFVTHYLAMCHTITNPLIYIWMNHRFRAGFKQVIRNLCRLFGQCPGLCWRSTCGPTASEGYPTVGKRAGASHRNQSARSSLMTGAAGCPRSPGASGAEFQLIQQMSSRRTSAHRRSYTGAGRTGSELLGSAAHATLLAEGSFGGEQNGSNSHTTATEHGYEMNNKHLLPQHQQHRQQLPRATEATCRGLSAPHPGGSHKGPHRINIQLVSTEFVGLADQAAGGAGGKEQAPTRRLAGKSEPSWGPGGSNASEPDREQDSSAETSGELQLLSATSNSNERHTTPVTNQRQPQPGGGGGGQTIDGFTNEAGTRQSSQSTAPLSLASGNHSLIRAMAGSQSGSIGGKRRLELLARSSAQHRGTDSINQFSQHSQSTDEYSAESSQEELEEPLEDAKVDTLERPHKQQQQQQQQQQQLMAVRPEEGCHINKSAEVDVEHPFESVRRLHLLKRLFSNAARDDL